MENSRNSLRYLLKKLSVFFVLLVMIACLLIAAPFPSFDAMGMYRQKHTLCEQIRGRKVLLVGGSGVLYSYDSALLEINIEGYRVVNMGLNAGLGLKFNLNEIRPYINPGDIVILIPEYSTYEGVYQGSVVTLMAINSMPRVLQSTPREHLKRLLIAHGHEFIPTKSLNYLNDAVLYLTRSAPSMNRNGDIVTRTAKRDVARMPLSCNFEFEKTSYKGCVSLLEDFDRYCRSKGAHAVLSFPAIPALHYEKNRDKLSQLHRNLSTDSGIAMLNSPDQVAYPLELFDDTIYHMDTAGKAVNTRNLLHRLAAHYPELIRGR